MGRGPISADEHFRHQLEIIIRKETAADIEAITEVTIAAFKTLPVSSQTEPFIIHALQRLGIRRGVAATYSCSGQKHIRQESQDFFCRPEAD